MKTKISVTVLLITFIGWAAADVPHKAPLTKYQKLWNESPFTTKPVIESGGPPPPSVLDDYALAGVSPIKGGYRVTIINKKSPEDRVYVYSDQPDADHGFRIESVERKAGDMRGTKVHMMSGGQKGTVAYEEKFLTIAAPQQPNPAKGRDGRVIAPPNPNQPAANPGTPAPNPGQQVSPRAPRPRVIGPPPAPQVRTHDNSTGQRPATR